MISPSLRPESGDDTTTAQISLNVESLLAVILSGGTSVLRTIFTIFSRYSTSALVTRFSRRSQACQTDGFNLRHLYFVKFLHHARLPSSLPSIFTLGYLSSPLPPSLYSRQQQSSPPTACKTKVMMYSVLQLPIWMEGVLILHLSEGIGRMNSGSLLSHLVPTIDLRSSPRTRSTITSNDILPTPTTVSSFRMALHTTCQ